MHRRVEFQISKVDDCLADKVSFTGRVILVDLNFEPIVEKRCGEFHFLNKVPFGKSIGKLFTLFVDDFRKSDDQARA
jgi:hypothetical protein